MRNIRKKILLITLAALLLYWFGYIVKSRSFGYGYNTRADYLYNFDQAFATIRTVIIRNNTFEISKFDSGFSTALLEISLKSRLLGYLSLPEIKLQGGALSLSQNLEYGGKGLRYLNISEYVQNNINNIKLSTHRCKIISDTCRLILYKNKAIANERLLVLSPHPDDAEIAAFGLYSANINSFIVTVTLGDAGKSKYENFYDTDRDHYLKKAELRFWNSITVPMLAGINTQNIVNLGYFDSKLKAMYDHDTLLEKSKFLGTDDITYFRSKNTSTFPDSLKGQSNWTSLVSDLKLILKKVNPTIIVTPYPAIDTHFDHKFTTIALFEAMKELNYNSAELWMYTNHYAKPDIYPVGNMNSLVSLPPYFNSRSIYFNKIYSYSLSKKTQIDKLFALDAMNDLRRNTEWQSIKELFQILKTKTKDKLYNNNNSYYRRSVRANELFFVIEAKYIFDSNHYEAIVGNTNQVEK